MSVDLRTLMDRMYAEGWEPKYSAIMKGALMEMKIVWSRQVTPRVTLISADSGREVTMKRTMA